MNRALLCTRLVRERCTALPLARGPGSCAAAAAALSHWTDALFLPPGHVRRTQPAAWYSKKPNYGSRGGRPGAPSKGGKTEEEPKSEPLLASVKDSLLKGNKPKVSVRV